MKKVCFFGIHNPSYTRNRVLSIGLERRGYEVVHCRIDPKKNKGIGKYLSLYREYKKIKHENFELVVVAFPGHTIVWLARLLFGKNIVFDAFVSLHNAKADRELYRGVSHIIRIKDVFFDWLSALLAERVLLDTHEHIKYYSRIYMIRESKFIRVLIGADDSLFVKKEPAKSEKFIAHYHGGFIRIQGIEYIIEAAELLRDEDIQFNLVGGGELVTEMRDRIAQRNLENSVVVVNEGGKTPIETVVAYAERADICLGIFADSPKTKRVIPTKIYEYMALGKATITSDTRAVREVFTDREDIILCPTRDPKALASAILELKRNQELRDRVASKSYEVFVGKASPHKIVEQLLIDIQKNEGISHRK